MRGAGCAVNESTAHRIFNSFEQSIPSDCPTARRDNSEN
jgi:hypothetical protein